MSRIFKKNFRHGTKGRFYGGKSNQRNYIDCLKSFQKSDYPFHTLLGLERMSKSSLSHVSSMVGGIASISVHGVDGSGDASCAKVRDALRQSMRLGVPEPSAICHAVHHKK
jgi:hypothetical protein